MRNKTFLAQGRAGRTAFRGKATLWLAACTLAACEKSSSVSAEGTVNGVPKKPAPMAPVVVVGESPPKLESAGAPIAAAVDQSDFASVWPAVRAALLRGDADVVAPFVRFPLEVHGEFDDDPVLKVAPEEFSGVVGQLLEDEVGLSFKPETLRSYLLRLKTLPDDAVAGSEARIASLVFRRTSGTWRLIRVYLDTYETSAWRK